MSVIVIANHKGGPGKTTVTVNVASALVQEGYRVLLIDMDPQGNSTLILSEISDEDPGLLPVLIEQKSAPLDSVIIDTPAKIALAPANIASIPIAGA